MQIPISQMPVSLLLNASVFLVAMSIAAIAPYQAIVATQHLGLSNSLYALVITLGSVAAAFASVILGYFSDRIGDRRLLIMACGLLGALGYGLIYFFPIPLVFILSFCLILPFGAALFSQLLAFSRVYFDQHYPQRSPFLMSALRTVFSLAWVLVPPLAGWIASTYTVFDIYAATALGYLGCMVVFGLLFFNSQSRIVSSKKQPGAAAGWTIAVPKRIGLGGVALVRVALALHLMVLPLALTKDLNGTLKDVGINAAVTAGLEIPFMLGWGLVALRVSKEAILVVNALLYGLYLLLLFNANSVREVLWLQGLNALSSSALMSINIAYVQEAIKGRVGLSTSLLSIVNVVSVAVASIAFNALSTKESYIGVFVAASLLSLVGAGMFGLSRSLGLVREAQG